MAEDLFGKYQSIMSNVPAEVKTAFDSRYMQKSVHPSTWGSALEKVAQGDYSGLGIEAKTEGSHDKGNLKRYLVPAAVITGMVFGIPYFL